MPKITGRISFPQEGVPRWTNSNGYCLGEVRGGKGGGHKMSPVLFEAILALA